MKHYLQKGYTLAEVLIIAVILLILASLASINLLNAQHGATLQATSQTLLATIKQQQIKAMTGSTEGRIGSDYYGIHFDISSYTLFHSTTYNAGDSANFTTPLDPTFQLKNITLPNGNIIFIPANGEVYGYSSLTNAVTLADTSSLQQKTIQFNYLGIITSGN